MMKQATVGVAVLILYVLYSLGVRHEQPVLTRPLGVTTVSTSSNSATSAPSSSSANTQNNSSNNGSAPTSVGTYKDGSYTGSVEDAFYGNVQVSATISGGKLTDVVFLQYPDTHSDSVMINQQAMPWLKQEAIQKQSANVDVISGATFTSQAFVQSLTNALDQAHSA